MLIAKSMVIDYTTSQFTPTDYTTPSHNLRMICVDVSNVFASLCMVHNDVRL